MHRSEFVNFIVGEDWIVQLLLSVLSGINRDYRMMTLVVNA